MNRRALKGSEKVLGVEHPSTLTDVDNLTLMLRYQRKYEAAEEMNRRALEGREKVLGVEHPDTLTSVYNLAYLFHDQQRYNDASILYLRALAGLSKTLGPDHPITRKCSYHYSSMPGLPGSMQQSLLTSALRLKLSTFCGGKPHLVLWNELLRFCFYCIRHFLSFLLIQRP